MALVLLAHLVGSLPLLEEVVVDFLPVTQIVADRRIDMASASDGYC